MLRISSFLAGDDYQMLKKSTPMSRKKVHSLATVLMLPVMMWFATGYLLSACVLDLPASVSYLVASFISIIIFIIERNIIMATGKGKLLIVMRLVIGAITALLGSIAIDEVIFKHDIDQQMLVNKSEMIRQRMIQVDSLYSFDIKSKTSEVESGKNAWHESMEIARREADGTGGSGRVGVSAITNMKMNQATMLEEDYLQSEGQLYELLQLKANDKIKAENDIEASFVNHALLQRIKALFDLVITDRYMFITYTLLTLFLFFIEFAVVLMKIGWKKTYHEHHLEAIERIGERRLDKFIDKDNNTYDAGSAYPFYKQAKDNLKKLGSVGLL